MSTVEQFTGQTVEQILDISIQFDQARSFLEQARTLMDQIGVSPQEWQTRPLLINRPRLNVSAARVLAERHDRMGYFPLDHAA